MKIPIWLYELDPDDIGSTNGLPHTNTRQQRWQNFWFWVLAVALAIAAAIAIVGGVPIPASEPATPAPWEAVP